MKSSRVALRFISAALVITFAVSEAALAAPVVAPASTVSPIEALLQDPHLLRVPASHASLREIHRGTSGRLLIHIQDAHANLSGQENAAGALEDILRRYGVELVLVEGGSGDDTLTPIKDIASPDIWKKVAKRFLVDGKISAEEYLNLTTDLPMKIIGVEDKPLYKRNLSEYAELAGKRSEALDYLSSLRGAVQALKASWYPAEIREFDALADEGHQTRAKEFFRLADRNGVSLNGYPNLTRLKALMRREESVDFEAATLEHASLAEELAKKGGGTELAASLEEWRRMKENKVSQSAYFRNTFDIALKHRIDLSRYPRLKEYAAYLEEFADLDLSSLVNEFEVAQEALYRATLTGREAKLLRAVDRFGRVLTEAHEIRLDAPGFAKLESNEAGFPTASMLSFLNRRLMEKNSFDRVLPYKPVLEEGRGRVKTFYGSVKERDFAFVKNAESAMDETGAKAAVLITGGYHTPHLTKLLREKGHSYAVLTPVITGETNQAKYERLLLGRSAGKPYTKAGVASVQSDKLGIEKTAENPQSMKELVTAAARMAAPDEATAEELAATAMLNFQTRERTENEGAPPKTRILHVTGTPDVPLESFKIPETTERILGERAKGIDVLRDILEVYPSAVVGVAGSLLTDPELAGDFDFALYIDASGLEPGASSRHKVLTKLAERIGEKHRDVGLSVKPAFDRGLILRMGDAELAVDLNVHSMLFLTDTRIIGYEREFLGGFNPLLPHYAASNETLAHFLRLTEKISADDMQLRLREWLGWLLREAEHYLKEDPSDRKTLGRLKMAAYTTGDTEILSLLQTGQIEWWEALQRLRGQKPAWPPVERAAEASRLAAGDTNDAVLSRIKTISMAGEGLLYREADGWRMRPERLPESVRSYFADIERLGLADRIAVVGGAVRDALMGQEPKDIDVAIKIDLPEELLPSFRADATVMDALSLARKYSLEKRAAPVISALALAYGTVFVMRARYRGMRMDRTRIYIVDGIVLNVSRRAVFTIDNMAVDNRGRMFFPRGVDSLADLAWGRLRLTPGEIVVETALRAVRYKHQYGFSLDNDLAEMLRGRVRELTAPKSWVSRRIEGVLRQSRYEYDRFVDAPGILTERLSGAARISLSFFKDPDDAKRAAVRRIVSIAQRNGMAQGVAEDLRRVGMHERFIPEAVESFVSDRLKTETVGSRLAESKESRGGRSEIRTITTGAVILIAILLGGVYGAVHVLRIEKAGVTRTAAPVLPWAIWIQRRTGDNPAPSTIYLIDIQGIREAGQIRQVPPGAVPTNPRYEIAPLSPGSEGGRLAVEPFHEKWIQRVLADNPGLVFEKKLARSNWGTVYTFTGRLEAASGPLRGRFALKVAGGMQESAFPAETRTIFERFDIELGGKVESTGFVPQGYQVFVDDAGRPNALLMEFVEGPLLGEAIRQGQVSAERALELYEETQDALWKAGAMIDDANLANFVLDDRTHRLRVVDRGALKQILPHASPEFSRRRFREYVEIARVDPAVASGGRRASEAGSRMAASREPVEVDTSSWYTSFDEEIRRTASEMKRRRLERARRLFERSFRRTGAAMGESAAASLRAETTAILTEPAFNDADAVAVAAQQMNYFTMLSARVRDREHFVEGAAATLPLQRHHLVDPPRLAVYRKTIENASQIDFTDPAAVRFRDSYRLASLAPHVIQGEENPREKFFAGLRLLQAEHERWKADAAQAGIPLEFSFGPQAHHIFRNIATRFLEKYPPEARVLSFVGLSGSGKSTLSKRLLADHAGAFVRLARTTTRPPREEDAALRNHRYATAPEFMRGLFLGHIVCHRPSHGFHYGYTVDDVLIALLSGGEWVMEALNSILMMREIWPGLETRIVGILPLDPAGIESAEYETRVREALAARIRRRDPSISDAEVALRMKESGDIGQIRREADLVLVNEDGASLDGLYVQLLAYLGLQPALQTQGARLAEGIPGIVRVPDLAKIQDGFRGDFTHVLEKMGSQSRVPRDPELLAKLGIAPGESVYSIGSFAGDWIATIHTAGAPGTYSDVDSRIVEWAREKRRSEFEAIEVGDALRAPEEPERYDWGFAYELFPLVDAWPLVLLRSLRYKKGFLTVSSLGETDIESKHFAGIAQIYGLTPEKTRLDEFDVPTRIGLGGFAAEKQIVLIRSFSGWGETAGKGGTEPLPQEQLFTVTRLVTTPALQEAARMDWKVMEALQQMPAAQTRGELIASLRAAGFDAHDEALAKSLARLTRLSALLPPTDVKQSLVLDIASGGRLATTQGRVPEGGKLPVLSQAEELDRDWSNENAILLYPPDKLYSRELELDEFDRAHYGFVEVPGAGGRGYWRSIHFPQLVLGDWRDIERAEGNSRAKMKRHVAVRYRLPNGKTRSGYYYDDHAFAVPYAAEAALRGEIPEDGAAHFFVDHHDDNNPISRNIQIGPGLNQIARQIGTNQIHMANLNTALARLRLITRLYWVHQGRKEFSVDRRVNGTLLDAEAYFARPDRPRGGQPVFIDMDTDATGRMSGVPSHSPVPKPSDTSEELEYFTSLLERLMRDGVDPVTFHANTTHALVDIGDDLTVFYPRTVTYGDVEIVRFLARVAPLLLFYPKDKPPQDKRDLLVKTLIAEHKGKLPTSGGRLAAVQPAPVRVEAGEAESLAGSRLAGGPKATPNESNPAAEVARRLEERTDWGRLSPAAKTQLRRMRGLMLDYSAKRIAGMRRGTVQRQPRDEKVIDAASTLISIKDAHVREGAMLLLEREDVQILSGVSATTVSHLYRGDVRSEAVRAVTDTTTRILDAAAALRVRRQKGWIVKASRQELLALSGIDRSTFFRRLRDQELRSWVTTAIRGTLPAASREAQESASLPQRLAESFDQRGYLATLDHFGITPQKYHKLMRELDDYERYFALTREEIGEMRRRGVAFFGVWSNPVTAQNAALRALFTIDGFEKAHAKGDVKKMAELYRAVVIPYTQKKPDPDAKTGQQAFFYEVGGMKGLMVNPRPELGWIKLGSPAAVLRTAIPELVDLHNPDALDPLQVENQYWSDINNVRYHVLQAWDAIPGFREARLAGNVPKLAELYKEHVIEGGGQHEFYNRAGLARVRFLHRPIELLRLFLPELLDPSIKGSLSEEVIEKPYWKNFENVRLHAEAALKTIPEYERASRDSDYSGMAEAYRSGVIGFPGGQKEFWKSHGLDSMIANFDPGSEEARQNSPYELMLRLHPELFDPALTPNPLRESELARRYFGREIKGARLAAAKERMKNFLKDWNKRYEKWGPFRYDQRRFELSSVTSISSLDDLKRLMRLFDEANGTQFLSDQYKKSGVEGALEGESANYVDIRSDAEMRALVEAMQASDLLRQEDKDALIQAWQEFADLAKRQIQSGSGKLPNEYDLEETLVPYYERVRWVSGIVDRVFQVVGQRIEPDQFASGEETFSEPGIVLRRKTAGIHFHSDTGYFFAGSDGAPEALEISLTAPPTNATVVALSRLVAQTGALPSQDTVLAIRQYRPSFNPEGAAPEFRRLMESPHPISPAIRLLFDEGYLEALIPEYGFQKNHYSTDPARAHRFTTANHMLFVLDTIERNGAGEVSPGFELLPGIYDSLRKDVRAWTALRWATITHDLTVDVDETPHPVGASVSLVPDIARRFGLEDDVTGLIRWLVWNHQELSGVAAVPTGPDRRHEERYKSRLARFAHESIDQFHMQPIQALYLFTCADVCSVNPKGRQSAKGESNDIFVRANELRVAYLSLMEFFDKEKSQDPIAAVSGILAEERQKSEEFKEALRNDLFEYIPKAINRLVLTLKEPLHQDEREMLLDRRGFDELFDRYVEAFSIDHLMAIESFRSIRRHQGMAMNIHLNQMIWLSRFFWKVGTGEIVVSTLWTRPSDSSGSWSELVIGVDRDSTGMLYKITGVLASYGFNIVTADIVTTADGRVINRFRGYFEPGDPKDPHGIEEALDADLDSVLKGKLSMRGVFAKAKLDEFRSKGDVTADAAVTFETSPISWNSAGEVSVLRLEQVPDRTGLVYIVSRILSERFGVNIVSAPIRTYSRGVADEIYVNIRSGDGHMGPLPEGLQKEIVAVLNDTLSRETITAGDVERIAARSAGSRLATLVPAGVNPLARLEAADLADAAFWNGESIQLLRGDGSVQKWLLTAEKVTKQNLPVKGKGQKMLAVSPYTDPATAETSLRFAALIAGEKTQRLRVSEILSTGIERSLASPSRAKDLEDNLSRLESAEFLSDGSALLLAVSDYLGQRRVYEVRWHGKASWTKSVFLGKIARVRKVAASSETHLTAVTTDNGVEFFVGGEPIAEVVEPEVARKARDVAVSPQGDEVAIAGSDGLYLRAYSRELGRMEAPRRVVLSDTEGMTAIRHVAYSPDSRYFAYASDRILILSERRDLKRGSYVIANGTIRRLRFSADGRRILLLTDTSVDVFDAESLAKTATGSRMAEEVLDSFESAAAEVRKTPRHFPNNIIVRSRAELERAMADNPAGVELLGNSAVRQKLERMRPFPYLYMLGVWTLITGSDTETVRGMFTDGTGVPHSYEEMRAGLDRHMEGFKPGPGGGSGLERLRHAEKYFDQFFLRIFLNHPTLVVNHVTPFELEEAMNECWRLNRLILEFIYQENRLRSAENFGAPSSPAAILLSGSNSRHEFPIFDYDAIFIYERDGLTSKGKENSDFFDDVAKGIASDMKLISCDFDSRVQNTLFNRELKGRNKMAAWSIRADRARDLLKHVKHQEPSGMGLFMLSTLEFGAGDEDFGKECIGWLSAPFADKDALFGAMANLWRRVHETKSSETTNLKNSPGALRTVHEAVWFMDMARRWKALDTQPVYFGIGTPRQIRELAPDSESGRRLYESFSALIRARLLIDFAQSRNSKNLPKDPKVLASVTRFLEPHEGDPQEKVGRLLAETLILAREIVEKVREDAGVSVEELNRRADEIDAFETARDEAEARETQRLLEEAARAQEEKEERRIQRAAERAAERGASLNWDIWGRFARDDEGARLAERPSVVVLTDTSGFPRFFNLQAIEPSPDGAVKRVLLTERGDRTGRLLPFDLMCYAEPIPGGEEYGIRGVMIDRLLRGNGLLLPLLKAYFETYPEVRRTHPETKNLILLDTLTRHFGFQPEDPGARPNAYLSTKRGVVYMNAEAVKAFAGATLEERFAVTVIEQEDLTAFHGEDDMTPIYLGQTLVSKAGEGARLAESSDERDRYYSLVMGFTSLGVAFAGFAGGAALGALGAWALASSAFAGAVLGAGIGVGAWVAFVHSVNRHFERRGDEMKALFSVPAKEILEPGGARLREIEREMANLHFLIRRVAAQDFVEGKTDLLPSYAFYGALNALGTLLFETHPASFVPDERLTYLGMVAGTMRNYNRKALPAFGQLSQVANFIGAQLRPKSSGRPVPPFIPQLLFRLGDIISSEFLAAPSFRALDSQERRGLRSLIGALEEAVRDRSDVTGAVHYGQAVVRQYGIQCARQLNEADMDALTHAVSSRFQLHREDPGNFLAFRRQNREWQVTTGEDARRVMTRVSGGRRLSNRVILLENDLDAEQANWTAIPGLLQSLDRETSGMRSFLYGLADSVAHPALQPMPVPVPTQESRYALRGPIERTQDALAEAREIVESARELLPEETNEYFDGRLRASEQGLATAAAETDEQTAYRILSQFWRDTADLVDELESTFLPFRGTLEGSTRPVDRSAQLDDAFRRVFLGANEALMALVPVVHPELLTNPYAHVGNVTRSGETEDFIHQFRISEVIRKAIAEGRKPRVLVIGAGIGESVRPLFDEYGDRIEVVPVNKERIDVPFETYLAELRQKLGNEAPSEERLRAFYHRFRRETVVHDVDLAERSLDAPGLGEDGTYDAVVVTRQTLRYIRHKLPLLAAIKRKLRPEGLGFLIGLETLRVGGEDVEEWLRSLPGDRTAGIQYWFRSVHLFSTGPTEVFSFLNRNAAVPFPEAKEEVVERRGDAEILPDGTALPLPVRYNTFYSDSGARQILLGARLAETKRPRADFIGSSRRGLEQVQRREPFRVFVSFKEEGAAPRIAQIHIHERLEKSTQQFMAFIVEAPEGLTGQEMADLVAEKLNGADPVNFRVLFDSLGWKPATQGSRAAKEDASARVKKARHLLRRVGSSIEWTSHWHQRQDREDLSAAITRAQKALAAVDGKLFVLQEDLDVIARQLEAAVSAYEGKPVYLTRYTRPLRRVLKLLRPIVASRLAEREFSRDGIEVDLGHWFRYEPQDPEWKKPREELLKGLLSNPVVINRAISGITIPLEASEVKVMKRLGEGTYRDAYLLRVRFYEFGEIYLVMKLSKGNEERYRLHQAVGVHARQRSGGKRGDRAVWLLENGDTVLLREYIPGVSLRDYFDLASERGDDPDQLADRLVELALHEVLLLWDHTGTSIKDSHAKNFVVHHPGKDMSVEIIDLGHMELKPGVKSVFRIDGSPTFEIGGKATEDIFRPTTFKETIDRFRTSFGEPYASVLDDEPDKLIPVRSTALARAIVGYFGAERARPYLVQAGLPEPANNGSTHSYKDTYFEASFGSRLAIRTGAKAGRRDDFERFLAGKALPALADWGSVDDAFRDDPALRAILTRAVLLRLLEGQDISIETQDQARFFEVEGDRVFFLDEKRERILVEGQPLSFRPDETDLAAARRNVEMAASAAPVAGVQDLSLAELIASRKGMAEGIGAALETYLAEAGFSGHVSLAKDVSTLPHDAARPEVFDAYAEHFLLSLEQVLSRKSLEGRVSVRLTGDERLVKRMLDSKLGAELLAKEMLKIEAPAAEPGRPVREMALANSKAAASYEGRPYLPVAPMEAGDVSRDGAHLLLGIFAAVVDPNDPPESFLNAYRTLLDEDARAAFDRRVAALFLSGDPEARKFVSRMALRAIERVDWTRLLQFFRNASRMAQSSA